MRPLVVRILQTFSDRDDVFSALSANLGTYSHWGSAIPHLDAMKAVLSQLIANPNARISTWAKVYIASLDKQMKQEKFFEAEMDIPRF